MAWQYYVALPWVFAALVAVHWTLLARDGQSRTRRAAVTGALVGVVGLTQLLFAAVAAAIVAVAFTLRRRFRALAIAGFAGLPFTGYYVVSTAARRQALGATARRTAAESLVPIMPRETVLAAVVALTIVLWLRVGRETESGVIEAGVLVAGPLWVGASLKSATYLSRFLPVVTYPLVAGTLAAGVMTVAEQRRLARIGGDADATDGGTRPPLPVVAALPRWVFVSVVVALSLLVTVASLAAVPPQYPSL